MTWLRRALRGNFALAARNLAAGAGLWLALPASQRAKLARQILADMGRRVLPAVSRPTPQLWSDQQLTLSWLGHASVLINFHGVRILTDPVFFNNIGVNLGLGRFGPKRYVRCALQPDAVPDIDLLLISHAHLDHLDFASLRKIRGRPQVVTAPEVGELLAGFPCEPPQELRWGELTVVRTLRGEVRVSAFEVNHWGRRWPQGKERGYNGYVIEREGKRILFAGDTAFTDSFTRLHSRGPFCVALMPIGAYNPWIQSHCTPEQAVQMASSAGAELIAPIHHSAFKLSDEPMSEPLKRFESALAGESSRIAWREAGQTIVIT